MAEKEKKVLEAEAKPKKAKKEKKKGRIGNAWRGFKSEFLKIAWPSWAQVRKNSWVVLVVVVICAILIGAFDFAFSQGMRALTGIFA
jgi:preprotein translocase SecE subunit